MNRTFANIEVGDLVQFPAGDEYLTGMACHEFYNGRWLMWVLPDEGDPYPQVIDRAGALVLAKGAMQPVGLPAWAGVA